MGHMDKIVHEIQSWSYGLYVTRLVIRLDLIIPRHYVAALISAQLTELIV